MRLPVQLSLLFSGLGMAFYVCAADAPPPPPMPAASAASSAAASASAAAKTAEAPKDISKENSLQLGKPEPERKITERKVNGKVVEAKVKSGKSQYVVKPNETPGALPGDKQSNQVRPAQWQVMEFGGEKKPKEDGAKDAKSEAAAKPASSAAK
ncbi:hypothetical protein V8J88_00190 [Massilia sp. W12]|uniref:hypothetical protein n=1 Tax=Massilia sp. W12 TaxID=3126507 RepID=UPI0030D3E68D